ncbi:MAG: hypothetical protein WAT21_08145 [Saprospiraceae bacterium]
MEITKVYSVYKLNSIMGNQRYKALESVRFKNYEHTTNSFGTEDEAIEALTKEGMFYEDFIVLRKVFIRR